MADQPVAPVTADNASGATTGTNAPVRNLNQTQSTGYNSAGYSVGIPLQDETGAVSTIRRNPETGELYDAGGLYPTVAPGVGATDDNPQANKVDNTTTRNYQDLVTEWSVKPQPNILDRYPSYTWQASVYMMSPVQANAYIKNPRKRPNGYNLLFQSGGAARGRSAPRGASAGTEQELFQDTDNRNPFFNNDFYIDEITFKTLVPQKGTQTIHSDAELKFSVFEPNNISLIDRLAKAAQDLSPTLNGKTNYASASYLMIISFWAQDQDGNIVQVGERSSTNPNGALVEKYLPFTIKTISYTISNNLVKYEWVCPITGLWEGTTTRWNSFRNTVELRGATVDEMLNGASATANAPTPTSATPIQARGPIAGTPQGAELAATNRLYPPGTTRPIRNSIGGLQVTIDRAEALAKGGVAPKINVSENALGLMDYLNAQEQMDVRNGLKNIANEYVLEYTPEAEALIKSALVRKDSETVNKAATDMEKAPSQDPQSANPDKGGQSINTRIHSVTAGSQVIKVIEQVIRSSSYIADQANIEFDEATNLPKPNEKNANKQNAGFKWFNVMTRAEKLGFDDKIRDYARRITYTVSTFNVALMLSPYFPKGIFPGLHKRYPYWFTGRNIAVLDYKETFNYSYVITNSGSPDSKSIKATTDESLTSSMVVIPYVMITARSSESSQGAQNRANDVAANAAENLFNPADLATAKITILGDPAWIMQGSMLNSELNSSSDTRGFNDDGSINFDTQQVLWEVVWQKPEDYDLATGLADPYSRTEQLYKTRQALQSRVYVAYEIETIFRGGEFTQIITGSLNPITVDTQPIKDAQNEFDAQNQAAAAAAAEAAGGMDTQSVQREQPVTDNRSVPAVTSVLSGATGQSTGGVEPASVVLNNDFFNAARMQNTAGGTSALLVAATPTLSNIIPLNNGVSSMSQMINSAVANAAPGIATLQTSPAPLPAISNGQVVGGAQPTTGNVNPVVSQPQNMARET